MIRKKDILTTLDVLDEGGYVNKNAFLNAVIALKEEEVNTFVIKKADILRGNIIKYQRRVAMKTEKGYLTAYIENLYKLAGKHTIEVYIADQKIEDKDIVIFAKDLVGILGISKPTFARLKKIGIITRYDSTGVRICIDGEDIRYRHKNGWLDYYNLNDIRENLNTYLRER